MLLSFLIAVPNSIILYAFTETLSAASEKCFPCFWGLFLEWISSSALKHLDTGYHVKDREKAGRQKPIIILLKHLSRATLDMQARRRGGGGGGLSRDSNEPPLTFDAAFSTKTAKPGNWGLKLLLRDALQNTSSFVIKLFVYLAGMFPYV